MRGRLGLAPDQFRITRGAMILLFLEGGVSLVWLLCPPDTRALITEWLLPSHDSVWHQGRVWTLVTGAFLEPSFIALLLHALIMFSFVPTLERFWGTRRFLRFVAVTQIVGATAGTALGFVAGSGEQYVAGLDSFIWASIVAFGIVYAKQQIQFWGTLPLTGRQMMFGFIGFLVLSTALRQDWSNGAAWGAAMVTAAIMCSKRWSPALAWKRWRIARARARLTVMQGGAPSSVRPKNKPKRDEQRFLN
ncbi:MAG TPA: rhomboid family intramembrane serine protease [Polyangiales bacterium]|jgi:membrane associated rhomboid family serine protease|nr:rhomboid family intramembrane serine protease [Kofleriaceae bacterium]